jgi:putative DNA primase/helicase
MRGLPLLIFLSAINANWGIRHMRAAGIAARIGAEPQGNNWRCDCPCGCGYGLSFCDGANGRLLAFCFGGCAFNQIMSALVEYGLLHDDDDDLHVSRGVTVCRRGNAERIAHARQIYDIGAWDERIAAYLYSRGIHRTSPVLRFSEQAPHRFGARLPAMLAPVVNVTGEQIGTHLTYLRGDGSGKAELTKEYQRESRGLIHGGAIRLFPFDPDVELVLAEGVETSLAASELFGLPCWSAVYAGGLCSLVLPLEVRHVMIAADNDASGVGQRNALAAYDRWRAEGRSVRIVAPPVVGDDFNDVLLKEPIDVER